MEVGIAEANRQFSHLVNTATYGKERVILTRRGRPVAVIIDIEELNRLESRSAREDDNTTGGVESSQTKSNNP